MKKISENNLKIQDNLQKRRLAVNIGVAYIVIVVLSFMIYYLTSIKDIEVILVVILFIVGILVSGVYVRQVNIELREQGKDISDKESKNLPTFAKLFDSDFLKITNPSDKLFKTGSFSAVMSAYVILIFFDREALSLFYHRFNNLEGLVPNIVSNDQDFLVMMLFGLGIIVGFLMLVISSIERVKPSSKSFDINKYLPRIDDYLIYYIFISFLFTHLFVNLPLYISQGSNGVYLPTFVVGLFVVLILSLMTSFYNFTMEKREENTKEYQAKKIKKSSEIK